MPKVWNIRDPNCPPGAVYIGRAMKGLIILAETDTGNGSKWANPYKIDKSHTRKMVIQSYQLWVADKIRSHELDIEELRGKDLVCWCAPEPCHGDVLMEILAQPKGE